MRTTILGIPFDLVTKDDAISRIALFCAKEKLHIVTTPNPEMLVFAQHDIVFRRVLQNADLSLTDGTGVVLASYLYGKKIPERVTGADMVHKISEWAAQNDRTLFLLGGQHGWEAERAAHFLQMQFPRLRIVGAYSGGRIVQRNDGTWDMDHEIILRLQKTRPDILCVGLGHGTQEKWINDHREQLANVHVAIGVGGTFDFLCGNITRAPKIIRVCGFEWLWRLSQQPMRWRRIITALFIFPYLVLKEKIGILYTL